MIYQAGETTEKGNMYEASRKILRAALPKRYNYINYSTFIVRLYNFYRKNKQKKERIRQFKEVKELVLQFKGDQRSVYIMRRLLCFFVVSLYFLMLHVFYK